jgi:hypothetical protein
MCYHLPMCHHLSFARFVFAWLLVVLQPLDALSGYHVASCCTTLSFAPAGCSIISRCTAYASQRAPRCLLMHCRLTSRACPVLPPHHCLVGCRHWGSLRSHCRYCACLKYEGMVLECTCCLPGLEGAVTVTCKEERARAQQQIFDVLCWFCTKVCSLQ